MFFARLKISSMMMVAFSLTMSTGCLFFVEESEPQAREERKTDSEEALGPRDPPNDASSSEESEDNKPNDEKSTLADDGDRSGTKNDAAPGSLSKSDDGRSGDSAHGSVPRSEDRLPKLKPAKPSKSKDPETARHKARRLLAEAEEKFTAGDAQRAYEIALEAWEYANEHAESNADCRKLAGVILERLKEFGDKANRSVGSGALPDKPLITQ